MITERYSELVKKYGALKTNYLSQKDLRHVRIAILTGSTVGHIKTILELSLLRVGIVPVFYEGQYNNYFEEGAFDNLSLLEFNPDFVYIHTTSRNLDFNEPDALYSRFAQIWDNISAKYDAVIIQNNFEPLPYRIMGNSDVYLENGRLYMINALNQRFYENARSFANFYINDINYLCALYGCERWWNDTYWYAYKYALDPDAVPLLCSSIANIVKSVMGLNKKALVLDLDNTIWGGVIGDDGVDGIRLGGETPEGMAYRDFQSYVKGLSKCGVMLNAASKNEESSAVKGFDHLSSILKKQDFIAFKANWEPKHKSIADIANELNIGLDSIVFIDDNPAERDIVKQYLPGVTVLEADSPDRFVRTLDREGFFEVTSFSKDDEQRNEYYRQNKQRNDSTAAFSNIDDYLASLEMKCFIESFNPSNENRLVQLINKTNQFNLTVKRYSAINDLFGSESHLTLCAHLTDKFGDSGIVSAIIASLDGNIALIDLWIMSCRVFKRRLEYALFDAFVDKCRKIGINSIKGFYVPTEKNVVVSNLYADLGFIKEADKNGSSTWILDIDGYKPFNVNCIKVKDVER